MAEIIYQHPVQEIKGALAKHGIINRRKLYRDDRGKIIHVKRQSRTERTLTIVRCVAEIRKPVA